MPDAAISTAGHKITSGKHRVAYALDFTALDGVGTVPLDVVQEVENGNQCERSQGQDQASRPHDLDGNAVIRGRLATPHTGRQAPL